MVIYCDVYFLSKKENFIKVTILKVSRERHCVICVWRHCNYLTVNLAERLMK